MKKKEIIIFTGSHEPITYTIVSSSGNVSRTTNYIEGVVTLIQRRYEEHLLNGLKNGMRHLCRTYLSNMSWCKTE